MKIVSGASQTPPKQHGPLVNIRGRSGYLFTLSLLKSNTYQQSRSGRRDIIIMFWFLVWCRQRSTDILQRRGR
ncbi:hypothetical protein FKM82_003002 [Ascaphus truei]